MTNEQKAEEISLLWWRECGWQLQAAAYDAAIEAMAWKDEEFAKQGYTKEQLLKMGFAFTLNGDIVKPMDTMKAVKKYYEIRKQRLIDKACEWIKELMIASGNYDAYDMQENLRDFKKAMEEQL